MAWLQSPTSRYVGAFFGVAMAQGNIPAIFSYQHNNIGMSISSSNDISCDSLILCSGPDEARIGHSHHGWWRRVRWHHCIKCFPATGCTRLYSGNDHVHRLPGFDRAFSYQELLCLREKKPRSQRWRPSHRKCRRVSVYLLKLGFTWLWRVNVDRLTPP